MLGLFSCGCVIAIIALIHLFAPDKQYANKTKRQAFAYTQHTRRTLEQALSEHLNSAYGDYAKTCLDQLKRLATSEVPARVTLARILGNESMTGRMYRSTVDDATSQLRMNCRQVLDMMGDNKQDTREKMRALTDANENILDGLSDIVRFGNERKYEQVRQSSDDISSDMKKLGNRISIYH